MMTLYFVAICLLVTVHLSFSVSGDVKFYIYCKWHPLESYDGSVRERLRSVEDSCWIIRRVALVSKGWGTKIRRICTPTSNRMKRRPLAVLVCRASILVYV